ncbi:hypothetical protein [Dyella sp. EPa41]|uniref:hypothetical protein n=1 Tax=Dyella sp. EPa41 TaxID=1561194 RepID=UPI001915ABFA|nr:hypothetical protein [Dyella sp. EPa41]
MKDFKAGGDINVGGDVYIYDNSTQHKLLITCTDRQLYEERLHRTAILSDERKRKWKRLGLAWLIVGSGFAAGAIWLQAIGQGAFSTLLLGLGGLTLAAASVKVIDEPTVFERRQLQALQEISFILKERGLE